MKFNEQNTQPYDWENEGIYVIEMTDPVEGGQDGVSNRQAKELTRRTRNLHTRMTSAEGEIDTLQRQTPIQVETALRAANTYTDGKEAVLRNDMSAADTATINAAKAYADQVVVALVDNSPEALNTLQELAEALGNDPNFATTVMQQIGERMKTTDVNAALAGKFDKSGGEIDGSVTMQYPDGLGGRWIKQVIAGADSVGLHMNRTVAAGSVSQLDVYTRSDDGFAKRMEIGRGILRFQGEYIYHSGNDDDIYMNRGSVIDANMSTTPGVYIYNENTSNCPSKWGTLFVVNSTRFISQTAYQTESANVWYRQQTNGGDWQPWRLMYHSGNLGEATQGAAGLISTTDKIKLDNQPTIIRGSVNAAGRSDGGNAKRIEPLGNGRVRVTHNLGSTSYSAVATVNGSTGTMDNEVNMSYKGTSYVEFTVTDGTGDDWQAAPFDFIIIPY